MAAVELEDPAGHVVEEVAIVGDGDDGAFVSREVLFQPGDHSASRWLVGSSSSRISGFFSSSRHSATRRRSPPESTLTRASPGGSAARPSRELDRRRGPRRYAVDLLLQLALLG